MEDTRLLISPSPHVRDEDTTQKIMFTVVKALLPVWIVATYFFGWDSIRLVVLASAAAIATEAVFQKVRNKPITVWDGSALITGMLLGLSVPPNLPSWMIVLGSVVAIGLGKQAFGGLGYNIFNPALVGRAFLTASFTGPMTQWITPFDAITTASPLDGGFATLPSLFFGNIPGSLGETSALAILLAGIYMFYKGVIDYRVPVGVLGTVAILAAVFGQDPVFHLLSGSLLFGAVFMATCMVTSPVTPRGRWIFGIGIGLVIVVIRLWGSLPEGVTFAILLMNAATPLINRWTRPRIYGQGVNTNA